MLGVLCISDWHMEFSQNVYMDEIAVSGYLPTCDSCPPPCAIDGCSFTATPEYGAAPLAVTFAGAATISYCSGTPSYGWNFGDGATGNGQTSTDPDPSVTYAADGTYAWTLTATSGAASCVRTGSIEVRAFDLHFLDDAGRSRLCVNSGTGLFEWRVLAGPGQGISPGVCQISAGGGLVNFTTARGLPYELRFRHNPATGRADGVFTRPDIRLQSGLDDRNAADNPPGCD